MNYSAAAAGVTVAVRLRRAIYHHAYRLGTLTIRSTGPGEAADAVSAGTSRTFRTRSRPG